MFSRLKKIRVILILLVISLTIVPLAEAKTPEERINESISKIKEMTEQEDTEAMAEVAQRAKGIAIFPSVTKAGLVIGGQYGEGLLLRRNAETGTWYGPSFVQIAGMSWGLQIGAQSTALVLVINNEDGIEFFMKGDQFKLGANVGVSAGPVGRQGEAATDVQFESSIYSYSMSKGLYAGLTLEGAEISVDENANQVYWGKPMPPEEALKKRANDSRIVPLTKEIEELMALAN